jgi:FtsP/CotA-like multicopper oxidase with cupredoxin domain
MISRRDFLKISMAGGAASFLAGQARFARRAYAAQNLQAPIPGTAIPQFVDPVPNLLDGDHLIVDSGTTIQLEMREHLAQVLPTGMPKTYTWSYLQPGQTGRTSYLGPVIVAMRGTPTEMQFYNMLGTVDKTNMLAYKYSTDQTLHWADPLNNEANMLNHMAMAPEFGSKGAANYGQIPGKDEFFPAPIPACVHLHGGEVPPELDGGPDAWFTSDGQYKGHGFYSKDGWASGQNWSIYRYPNSQEGALIWFHDHTLGATRLNVFCGLAGGYLLLDPSDTLYSQLPEKFALVIQDRSFDMNGQFFLPANSAGGILWAPNPEHPYWVPEFVGDTILVNGKTWPYMNVAPKRYTFFLINGSNARTYEMAFTDPVSKNPGPAMWVIGTDGGYLDKPVKIDPMAAANNKHVMMSGERYWVIVDFKGYEAGVIGPNGIPYSGTWMLKNTAKAPFPNGATPTRNTVDRIMEFRVVLPLTEPDTSFNPALPGATLRSTPMVRLTSPKVTRQLTLNEVMGMPQNVIDPVTGTLTAYPGGPLEILVNNTKWSGKRIVGVDDTGHMYMMEPIPGFTPDQNLENDPPEQYVNYLSELPKEGETELWEIINLTADAHPIHLHLVQFQLLNRQNFDFAKYNAAYNAAFLGGGYDHMTGQPYPAGVYIPAFGPPLNYNTGNPAALGGNPNINALSAKGKPLYLQGKPIPGLPQENGWKDTVIMYPGQVTRILVRWAPTDVPASTPAAQANFPFNPRSGGQGYVWHCHIVDHEDNEMMRPDEVEPNTGVTRTFVRGTDY